MVNHISNLTTHFASPLISSLRELTPEEEGSEQEKKAIQKIGQQFQQQITEEMQFIERENYAPPLLAQAHFCDSLSDPSAIQAYHSTSLSQNRECAYEISNIGVVKLPSLPNPPSEGARVQFTFEKLVFSQCAMLCGAAIGCSVASLADGPLTICFSYQEGILSSDFMEGLRDYVGRRLRGFGA